MGDYIRIIVIGYYTRTRGKGSIPDLRRDGGSYQNNYDRSLYQNEGGGHNRMRNGGSY